MDQRAAAQAAELLVAARRTGKLIDALPESCRPETIDDAHAIQAATVAALGESIAAWKVSLVDGRLLRGAILGSVAFASPARVPAKQFALLGVEVEIAFRFLRDMPPRARDYGYDEVADAVVAFPAIEIVDSRFADYANARFMDRAADCVSNGGFVRGPDVPGWRKHDLATIEAVLAFDGKDIVRRNGGHVAGDPLKPAIALVNDLRAGGGVKAGAIMTTGTYTGLALAKPGQVAVGTFTGFGVVEVHFA